MSDDESLSVEGVDPDNQYLTAEYKDGQLQIVEVTPFEKDRELTILPDDGSMKYLINGRDENGLVQLDLLNLTLVKCNDGEESYRLVTTNESGETSDVSDATVTCVLQSSDGEDADNQNPYILVESAEDGSLMVESAEDGSLVVETAEDGSLPVYFQSQPYQSETTTVPTTVAQPEEPSPPKKPLTPAELLQRAKAMKKARAIMSSVQPVRLGKRGRRAKGSGDLPMVHQLLSSPQFKLYLYSCKMCNFKCNAVKQLQAHRTMNPTHIQYGVEARQYGDETSQDPDRSALHKIMSSPDFKFYLFSCKRCNFKCNALKQLQEHRASEHGGAGGGGYGGGAGGTRNRRIGPLRTHTHTHTHGQMVEAKPEFVFGDDESITITGRVSLDSKEIEEADVLVCGACGFESGCRETFRNHIQDVHGACTS